MEENKKVVETEVEEKESTSCMDKKLIKKIKSKFKKDKDVEIVKDEEKKPKWKKAAKFVGAGLGGIALIGIGYTLRKGNAPAQTVDELVEDVSKDFSPEVTETVVETME